MAIALTLQPTADGLYSGYLPVKFTATEVTNSPAYLEFDLKTSVGASITGVPTYRAANIGGEYFFDASNYLKSVLDVRSSQGLSTTAIEELGALEFYQNFSWPSQVTQTLTLSPKSALTAPQPISSKTKQFAQQQSKS